jgi:hypothetical protein
VHKATIVSFTSSFEEGGDLNNNNFTERSVRPEFISKRGYLASSPSTNSSLQALDLVASGGQWFSFDSGWDGVLTAQATGAKGQAAPELKLYDNNMQLVASSAPGSLTPRIDYTGAPGVVYFLSVGGANTNVDVKLTNVVHQSGDTVTITGTDADDVFQFAAGVKNVVVVNGVSYEFDPAKVKNIVLDGGAGANSVSLVGSAGADVANFAPGSGSLSGAGYSVKVKNFTAISVNGGGGADVATLHDSVLGDHLTVDGDWANLANDIGLAVSLQKFGKVTASSTAGGADSLTVKAHNFVFDQDGNWAA